jgi:hypothetical protein
MRKLWMSSGLLMALAGAPVCGHHAEQAENAGSWVSVSVTLDGRTVPLYAASSRWYLEARAGANYEIALSNRTGERLGVVLDVDGLNVISGDIEARPASKLGRMYVLDPWGSVTVRGWRTSLEAVRRFVFVDEKASYAARAGKANSKMGWIEIAVHREHRRPMPVVTDEQIGRRHKDEAANAPAPAAEGSAKAQGSDASEQESRTGQAAPAARSFPGTGWGSRTHDQAVLVDFEPEVYPVERLNLRYEYRGALQALGLLPAPPRRDRLSERELAIDGFAQPPRW